jgi:hypothetical protein
MRPRRSISFRLGRLGEQSASSKAFFLTARSSAGLPLAPKFTPRSWRRSLSTWVSNLRARVAWASANSRLRAMAAAISGLWVRQSST